MRLQNGIDLVEIDRMEKCLQRESFWEKCFSAREQAYIKAQGNKAAAKVLGPYVVVCGKCLRRTLLEYRSFVKQVGAFRANAFHKIRYEFRNVLLALVE